MCLFSSPQALDLVLWALAVAVTYYRRELFMYDGLCTEGRLIVCQAAWSMVGAKADRVKLLVYLVG